MPHRSRQRAGVAIKCRSNPWYVAGNPPTSNTAAISSAPTVLQASPNYGILLGYNGADTVVFEVDARPAVSGDIDGISGFGRGTGTGVSGTGVIGVYGTSTGGSFPFGVVGSGTGGVYGTGTTFGAGGQSMSGDGVSGATTSGNGVKGDSGSGIGVFGITATGPYAIAGHATQNVGVYGLSEGGPYPYGVVGQVNVAGGYALFGSATKPGSVAFGGTAYGSAIAGQFIGPVNVYGQITLLQQTQPPSGTVNAFIVGPGVTKNAAVEMPDGTHALMHCVEAPEPWFEDFGEGTLVAGKAEVKLDAEFLHTGDTSKLHVFLTEHDEHHALHLAGRSATGFTVVADAATLAAKGKKAADVNGTFTYRVVAKRRDVKGDRLMRVELPKPIEAKIPPIPKLQPAPPMPKLPKQP